MDQGLDCGSKDCELASSGICFAALMRRGFQGARTVTLVHGGHIDVLWDSNTAFVIKEGIVCVSVYDGEGNVEVRSIASTGDVLNLSQSLSSMKVHYDIWALVDSQVCRCDLRLLRNSVVEDPDFLVSATDILSDNVTNLYLQAWVLSGHTVSERVARLMSVVSGRAACDGLAGHLTIYLTKGQIADIVNAERNAVGSALGALQREGLVILRRGRVEIVLDRSDELPALPRAAVRQI